MKFAVRYWSSLFPKEARQPKGMKPWVIYSLHPPSKLGLHSAMLSMHDRLEILAAHGGEFVCALFVLEDEKIEPLPPELVDTLFSVLPKRELTWAEFESYLHPSPIKEPESVPFIPPPAPEPLPTIAHTHTLYDDLEPTPHILDVDAR